MKLSAFSHPMAKFHAMDLFNIRYQLTQLCDYVKRTVTSLRSLAGLVPGPSKRIDPMKPRWMNGAQVSNLCQLLDSLSWILDEKNHIQELAGISREEYTVMYKLYLGDPKSYLRLPKGKN